MPRVYNKLRRAFAAYDHLNYFPLPRALKGYNAVAAKADFRAGLNVALLAFPQGMAYAAIAGLPIQYGIYGSAIAAVFGALFAGSRFIILGPTNATSVLIFASFLSLGIMDPGERVAMIALITLLSGLFLMLGALLKVANLIQYISRSVVAGYISAAAIYIIVNQLKKVLGFDFTLPEGSTFITVVHLTLSNLTQTHWPSLLSALFTIAGFHILQRFSPRLPNVAIMLVIASGFTAGLNALLAHYALAPQVVTLTAIDAASWGFSLPSLRADWISMLAGVALVIAFLSVLEGSSIGKSLASRSGRRLDTNQEMFGMGAANVACAFFQGMPASGSLTRSQLSADSGSQSAVASIFSGLLCALGAFTLGAFTGWIPVPVLAALVILIGLSLVNRPVLRVVWNATQSDRVVFLVTFLAALLVRLDFAIILGTGVSILLFLRKAAQPELIEYAATDEGDLQPRTAASVATPEVSIVHVEGDLFFGASELFRDQMRRICEKPNLKVVILKMRNAYHLDATSVLALEELVRYMREQDRILMISEIRKDALRIFSRSGLIETIGRSHIFPDHPSNPTLASAKALRAATKLLGNSNADVRIFLGSSRKQD